MTDEAILFKLVFQTSTVAVYSEVMLLIAELLTLVLQKLVKNVAVQPVDPSGQLKLEVGDVEVVGTPLVQFVALIEFVTFEYKVLPFVVRLAYKGVLEVR